MACNGFIEMFVRHLTAIYQGPKPPAMQNHPAAPSFRDDLQILRALAVILVFLFHLDAPFFGGGYIGVDIFFVLSGYFMAQTLPKIEGKEDVLSFYNRRLRRILPLAWIVFLLFFAVSPFLFTPPEMKELTGSFLSSLFLIPNLSYWLDNSYFESTLFRPMLHYWSLGVEYQYYILFPLALFAMKRWSLIGPVFLIGSLVLCIAVTELSPKTAFFWTPTRFWEFLLGYYAHSIEERRRILPRWAEKSFLALAALAFASCTLLFSSKTVFPGAAAILPAFAAFLFILGKMPSWPKLLRLPEKLLIGIGTISFSVYLWHYPVIFLATYSPFEYGGKVGLVTGATVVCLTLALSCASYFWIEKTFRNRQLIPDNAFYKKWVTGLFALSLTLAAIYAGMAYGRNFYSPHDQKIFSALDDRLPYRCGTLSRFKDPSAQSYELASGGQRKRVLLAGNSHADAIKAPFIDLAKDRHASFFLMQKNCNPGQDGCSADMFLQETAKNHISDFVFHGLIHGDSTFSQLEKLIPALLESGVIIHIIDPTPIYKASVPASLYRKENVAVTEEEYRQKNKSYFEWKSHAQEKWPAVKFYETVSLLCKETCAPENEGAVLYYDSHHLTTTGARLLTPIIEKIYE
jgi:peptidoglycan/LPS O-acetylase OafA/YrhL